MAAPPERDPSPALPRELDRILHDLRGPLNALFLHVDVLKNACARDDETARRSLEIVERSLRRLSGMLDAAFSVAGLERGRDTAVSLRAVVDQVIHAQTGPVTVRCDTWPDVQGDRDLLSLALGHLVRNALEATAAAGPGRRPPEVSAEVDGKQVVVAVRDWGVGLASTDPRSVMRLGASTKPGGEGIGLLVAERIARLHGGALAFHVHGAGAEVRLTLPLETG